MTLDEALKHFKTKTDLAKALGISKQAVSNWEDGKPIPDAHALRLQYEIIPALEKTQTTAA